jgi:predicted homoserine dehydrogenase-like protein
MNLTHLAAARSEAGKPIRVGLIGAGKFGSMFLAQVPTTKGIEVAAIADLDVGRAQRSCREVGWTDAHVESVAFTDDSSSLFTRDDVEVVVEATGNPAAGVDHALLAIEHGKHIVMVNVEADVLAGAYLAEQARRAGVVYSMAYGDQPALTAELIDWARATGFTVVAAGKGTKYLPVYNTVTPDDVWDHYGLTQEEAADAGMNPRMFNSFLDGTKSALEMAAIANACDLTPPSDGLLFPPCGVDDLPHILRPQSAGGVLEQSGMVEVVSCVERDGRPVFRDLRWGVYVVLEALNDYAAGCFRQYGLKTDDSGRFAAMYKPYHLIGLELNISIMSAALRGEPTGQTRRFAGDVVAVAKRALKAGEIWDGEGGYTVWGKLLPAADSLARRALPIGLAHGVALVNDIAAGQIVTWDDVAARDNRTISIRRAMEAAA